MMDLQEKKSCSACVYSAVVCCTVPSRVKPGQPHSSALSSPRNKTSSEEQEKKLFHYHVNNIVSRRVQARKFN